MEAYESVEVGMYLIPKAWNKKGAPKLNNLDRPSEAKVHPVE